MENPNENQQEHDHDHNHNHDHDHDHDHDHGHVCHKHIHSRAEKTAVINRLSKAAGHIEAIKRMVDNDMDCSQILIQLAAVRAAINNTGNLVLKNHISECIVEAVKQGDDQAIKDLNNAIDQFLK
jgi:DNA-binding FrmR family transcriptional regulator